ncbi:MAG: hypothetical protein AB9891_09820 [Anaerolineaceae bacterium]
MVGTAVGAMVGAVVGALVGMVVGTAGEFSFTMKASMSK